MQLSLNVSIPNSDDVYRLNQAGMYLNVYKYNDQTNTLGKVAWVVSSLSNTINIVWQADNYRLFASDTFAENGATIVENDSVLASPGSRWTYKYNTFQATTAGNDDLIGVNYQGFPTPDGQPKSFGLAQAYTINNKDTSAPFIVTQAFIPQQILFQPSDQILVTIGSVTQQGQFVAQVSSPGTTLEYLGSTGNTQYDLEFSPSQTGFRIVGSK
ncbi:hypothetical protein [Bacillus toyonensis]|uniref:hypothetical protein n=1 Tax=Bacillus toyonensis TaxID=155322 RepID=UPI002E22D8CB|nr:hypothetical protein [Bacillus toyonensis]